MEISDKFKDADVLYREPLRGQFHFSPREAGTTRMAPSTTTTANIISSFTQSVWLELWAACRWRWYRRDLVALGGTGWSRLA